ncbi:16S rRNA (guanine(966)-N(2))-methyltransferase RsmD [Raoultibacter massiliensis]|uniref:16S rRNA (Guanine(966)-N(2))-methyltransferase RsmD n=1 Tax=Raoultibacter massiliensis TaxID=1852371 RepID=A0ABV1JB47_9ACTN|nr:16S rRNA (guanine(966)-N(2))-methyltransferase RsmD [Raoultibacter massiliensis]
MRIIAGEYRGRVLKAPKGEGTRPTTDRVREALMSVIASARGGFDGAVVLDAFAGSGALGIEALSRGAASAQFFERDGAAIKTLADNIRAIGVEAPGRGSRAQLRRGDVLKKPPIYARPAFDLVFLDPPYATDPIEISRFVDELDRAGALAPGALVSYEYAKSDDSAVEGAFQSLQWETVSKKHYGDTAIALFGRMHDSL